MPVHRAPRVARALAAALSLASLTGLAACVTQQTVSLRMTGNVPDASVTIDDQYVGSLAYVQRRGVAMPPGKHRVTIEKVGYFPWDRLVESDEAPVQLDVQLVPIPD